MLRLEIKNQSDYLKFIISEVEMTPYQKLEKQFKQISLLGHAKSILGWDEATMMPTGGSQARNECLAELATLSQSMLTQPEVALWLEEVTHHAHDLSLWQKANVREMKRAHRFATGIPKELNHRLVLAKMKSEQAWRQMRAQNAWADFQPILQEVLNLQREALQALSQKNELSL